MTDVSTGIAYEDRLAAIMDGEADLTRGAAALSMNVAAARAIAGTVRTTLGPNGMDKMLVDRRVPGVGHAVAQGPVPTAAR